MSQPIRGRSDQRLWRCGTWGPDASAAVAAVAWGPCFADEAAAAEDGGGRLAAALLASGCDCVVTCVIQARGRRGWHRNTHSLGSAWDQASCSATPARACRSYRRLPPAQLVALPPPSPPRHTLLLPSCPPKTCNWQHGRLLGRQGNRHVVTDAPRGPTGHPPASSTFSFSWLPLTPRHRRPRQRPPQEALRTEAALWKWAFLLAPWAGPASRHRRLSVAASASDEAQGVQIMARRGTQHASEPRRVRTHRIRPAWMAAPPDGRPLFLRLRHCHTNTNVLSPDAGALP